MRLPCITDKWTSFCYKENKSCSQWVPKLPLAVTFRNRTGNPWMPVRLNGRYPSTSSTKTAEDAHARQVRQSSLFRYIPLFPRR